MKHLVAGGSVLALASACVLFRASEPNARADGAPRIEFQNARFDGEYLMGRLLVGAAGGPVTIDARLIRHSTVHVEDVFDCVTHEPLEFLMADSFTTPPRSSELLTLTEGHWYGADLDLLVFAEKLNKRPSPDCIEARLVFLAEPTRGEERASAELTVRVARTTPTAQAVLPDGGTDER
jgi:hypothetical protein